MKDEGLDKGLIQQFDTDNSRTKGFFYGFRAMFWKYLTKLGVPFYDPCCPTAGSQGLSQPVRVSEGNLETLVDGEWEEVTTGGSTSIPATSYDTNAEAVTALGVGVLYKSTTLINGSPIILITV